MAEMLLEEAGFCRAVFCHRHRHHHRRRRQRRPRHFAPPPPTPLALPPQASPQPGEILIYCVHKYMYISILHNRNSGTTIYAYIYVHIVDSIYFMQCGRAHLCFPSADDVVCVCIYSSDNMISLQPRSCAQN